MTDNLAIDASPNLKEWTNSFPVTRKGAATIPGLFVIVEPQAAPLTMATVAESLDNTGIPADCDASTLQRESYDDGFVVGFIDLVVCDGGGGYGQLMAFEPDSPTNRFWIEGRWFSWEGFYLFNHALDTFYLE